MKDKEIESVCPENRQQWRRWLAKNHSKVDAVWLICYKKEANKPTIAWSDAVDEALCFGWIDSIRKTLDDQRFIQRFSKRKANGTWSKVNKSKVKQLVKSGMMAEAGMKAIQTAKRNGAWTILDDVEKMIIPDDLEKAFRKKPGSKSFFIELSRSVKRVHLLSLAVAKKTETREKRILEIVALSTR
jgi:uncharacterized protein YdeI (YjbR/CyaY-like superfamily)